MNNDRMNQIDSLILRETAVIIQREFPDLFVSITKVEVSRDLAHAKLWVSETKNADVTAYKLNKKRAILQKFLAKKVELRRIPLLHFIADHSSEKAGRIEELLSEIKKGE